MKQLLSLGVLMVFLTPLLLGISSCAGPGHQGGSTYEKSKSDYEKQSEGSGGY